jgi:hypothetical protein
MSVFDFDFDFGDFDLDVGGFDFGGGLSDGGYFLGAEDAFDPIAGLGDDVNGNGVPDIHEYEFIDVDGNRIPDYVDGNIQLTDSGLPLQVEGPALDLDGNGIADLQEGRFLDMDGNGIPDLHEPFQASGEALDAAALRRHLSRVVLKNPFIH